MEDFIMENNMGLSLDFKEQSTEEQGELIEVSTVNRSVLILHFNDDFYSWYRNTTPTPESKEKVLESPHTFLIPPVDTDEEVEDYLAENFFVVFESILEEFIESEDLLIEALTEENFDKWVDYNFSTFVMDAAADYELGYEESEIEGSPTDDDSEEYKDDFSTLGAEA